MTLPTSILPTGESPWPTRADRYACTSCSPVNNTVRTGLCSFDEAIREWTTGALPAHLSASASEPSPLQEAWLLLSAWVAIRTWPRGIWRMF